MAVKGLDKALQNLEALDQKVVPRASVQAINRVAGRAISKSTREVSGSSRVPRKLVNQRAKLTRATLRKPRATIQVNRGNLPAIKLGVASVRLNRRKGMSKGGAVLQVGRFKFPGAFIQQLANGRWHVLQRTTKARYPVEVVSIPLAIPLTTAFNKNVKSMAEDDMSKEFAAALKNQLRIISTR